MSEAFSMKWVVEKQGFTTRIRFKKRLFNSKENQKTQKKRPSSVDETRKTLKNTRRRSTKREKRWKTLVVGRRNAKNAEKTPVIRGWNRENGENKLSAVAETEKTTKIGFPPRRMSRKQQKQHFGHGRNWKTVSKQLSRPTGNAKTAAKQLSRPTRNAKTASKQLSRPTRNAKTPSKWL